jgi:Holliday junction resolvase-like predicted endonuclease
MRLFDRLRLWSEIQRVHSVEESPDITGGRDAEVLLKELVGSSFHFQDANVFAGRRIPSKRQGRRREIDLIVCTPKMIHLIEIKNWSGRLDIRGGVWCQTRRSGQVVEHADMFETNRQRLDAVVEYLQDQGLSLGEAFVKNHIVTKIIFMNPRLELDRPIEDRPDVISRRELDDYLGKQGQRGLTERMFSSLIELCRDRESRPGASSSGDHAGEIPPDRYKRIVALLSQTSTWDQLHLHGTKVVTGDVVAMEIGAKSYRRRDLVDRSADLPLRLEWTRGRVWGLLKAVLGHGPLGSLYLNQTRLELSSADTVVFHAVGEPEPGSRKLVEVEQIILG